MIFKYQRYSPVISPPAACPLAVQGGALRVLHEGRARNFGCRVQQVTFSGKVTVTAGKSMLYVTERCILRLTSDGLELAEVAPKVEIERDILAHMDFRPIMNDGRPMDPRLFWPKPTNLKVMMLNLSLDERLAYDAERNMLFLNFEGAHVRRGENIATIEGAVAARCTEIDRRVAVVVNYDAFRLEPEVAGAYADMVRGLEDRFYTRVSRHMTSAFIRVKLGQTLTRAVRPHIFESRTEAQAFHETVSEP